MAQAFLVLGILVLSLVTPATLRAQSNVSGDIAGAVTDPSGKAVVGATVTVKSTSTGATKVVNTGNAGNYRISLLTPGQYTITVAAPGFETTASTLNVSIGQVNTQDLQLAVGSGATTVEVTGTEVPLLHTENANITTTFDMQQVQALPNPGNDLTFVAQTAPGVVMNTQGGYGNFSAFGLPATSNTFTVNGGYENDPFLNVNNSGATNLLLGNNDVSDVSVVSNAYTVEFGGLGGAQINETSRSGGNKFHGNAVYWWNGRAMNANSYFHNQPDPVSGLKSPRSFDNVNQYAAAIGGPIYKDHSFFFFNYEGLRVVLPTSGITGIPNAGYIQGTPNPGYATTTLGADGQCDNATSSLYNFGNANECAFYKQLFGVYSSAKGAAGAGPYPGDPLANQLNYTQGNFTHEYLYSGRIDQSFRSNDHIFGHFKVDKGLQATYTDPLNPIFNADSPQPQYEGQLNEAHTFSPNLVNQFIFATIYYRAIFTNTNQAAASALAPFSLFFASGSFQGLGGLDTIWPQGRNVTGYQFIDDVSWNKGKNTIKFGFSFRRDDVTDYSPSGTNVTPEVVAFQGALTDPPHTAGFAFNSGNSLQSTQSFPTRLTQPLATYNEGFYLQDSWKALPNLTINGGIRFEHNSNPVCITNCFSRLSGDVATLAGSSLDTPYNQLIVSGQHRALPGLQALAVEPRAGFAYSPFGADSHTVIRGGAGFFADSFPAQLATNIDNNAPTNINFTVVGAPIDPTVPNSAVSIAQTSANAFRAAFANGGSFNSISAATGGTFVQPNFTAPEHKVFYPSYEEWSLQVEQQIRKSTTVSVAYVGNHGYKEPVLNNSANAFGFFGLPAAQPIPSFNLVTQVYSGASSNFNGLVTSVVNRSRYVTLQFNYEWSHALDEISNGGFDSFGGNASLLGLVNPANLAANYGNADYDTHQNITGSYVITIPYKGGPRVLTDGWEVAGTVFHNTGFPFSVTDTATSGSFSEQGLGLGSVLLAHQLTSAPRHCASVYKKDGSGLPCFTSTADAVPSANPEFDFTTGFGQGRRNAFYGPGYTDTDLSLLKSFKVPGLESGKLTVGAQFFNVLNHPNFAIPDHNIGDPTFGLSTGNVNPPTSILGSFLGGDASPRLIQFKGSFTF